MAILDAGCQCKTWNIARVEAGTVPTRARRKIENMGVSRNQHEHAPRPDTAGSDAETMRDLQQQVQAARPLTDGEQERLLERAGLGDKASQERLVAVNLGMVIRLADGRGEQGMSVPDLVQEGSIGLVEAVRSFANSGESDFVHFAEQHVGAQMDAAIAAEAAATGDAGLLVAAATDYERTQMVLRIELHRSATEKELAEKLEWTVERTRHVAQVVADARRRHDEEMLEFIDPEAIDFDAVERDEFGS
jgi:DNA-directed RNA polymerase sigma subunit (sigma70/sigma32)